MLVVYSKGGRNDKSRERWVRGRWPLLRQMGESANKANHSC